MALIRAFWLPALVLLLIAGSCAPAVAPVPSITPGATIAAAHYPVTVTDDRGKPLTLAAPPARVVSLAPSATEIVFALGAGDRLVATDDFSDFPPEAKALPKVGGFRASPDKIVSYRPDLILAIPGTLPQQLEAIGQPLFVFDPSDIEAVYVNIRSVGAMLDREPQAEAVIAGMRSRVERIGERVKTAATRPRVLHEVDSTNPAQIFVAGPHNFIDSIITTVGGRNVAADAPVAFPKFSPEEIVARDPEVIVLADFAFGATPEIVAARPGWAAITAVKKHAIYPIDDNLVSRPGPRLVLGFEAYAKLVHPEIFGSP